jgi:alpha-tubulin suppressor-like RCC1 family protein
VRFGERPASFTVESATTIKAVSPPYGGGSASVNVSVTTPSGTSEPQGSSILPGSYFRYGPTVTGVLPKSGSPTGGTPVRIFGTGFSSVKGPDEFGTFVSAVKFGSVNATSFTVLEGRPGGEAEIEAVAPPGTGTVDVTVETSGGTSPVTAADHFSYVPAPTVSGVEPKVGRAGGGTSVTITGTNFTEASSVRFGANSASSFTVNSESSITAVSPAGTGTVDVTVTTPGGTSATGTPDQFTYGPVPTVIKVEPNSGPAAGGTSVTITGTNLTGATAVKFGSTNATSFTVNSATSITAGSPAGTGTVDVTVTTPEGTSATGTADQFTYGPTVTRVEPNTGPASGGTPVTITGTGFTGTTAVKFGATGATSFTVNSPTAIKAVSPAGSGTVDVTVTTSEGTTLTSPADQFSYGPGVAPGGVAAWGSNEYGALGRGSEGGSSAVAEGVSGLSGVAAISAGEHHGLALLPNNTVMSWGFNESGQLGNGTTTNSSVPVAVTGLSEVAAISAGYYHSLALLKNGTVMAWGDNRFGELGNGTTTNSDVPVKVNGLSEVVAISAGTYYSVAVLKNGTVMAWGTDTDGVLCGTPTEAHIPVAVSGLSEVAAVATGRDHILVLLKNGTVVACGENADGQLGNGTHTSSTAPVAVSGLTEATAVSAGAFHSMALRKNGTVVAWGLNETGELGNGTTANSDVPVAVSGLSEVMAIADGEIHSLALLKDGEVKAWGFNSNGQLGNNSFTTSTVPETVIGLSEITSIAAGGPFGLATRSTPAAAAPKVTGVEPTNGPSAGGTTVTINGENFTGASAVKFGTSNASSFTVNSSTSITAVAPAYAGGSALVDVSVTTPAGTSPTGPLVIGDGFGYQPAVTSVSPKTGPATGGTSVRISGIAFGASFKGGTPPPCWVCVVKFGSANATSFKVLSEGEIEAVAPPGRGTVDITVQTLAGTSSAGSADQFSYEPPTVHGEFSNWVLSGALHIRKLNQEIALPEGSRFNGTASINLETQSGPLSGTVTVPGFNAMLKILGTPATVGMEFTQVGSIEGSIAASTAIPGDFSLSLPTRANIGFSSITIFGLKIATKCVTSEPLAFNLLATLPLEELLSTGAQFMGTTKFPTVKCEGTNGSLVSSILTSLFSGPSNPYSFTIGP